MVTAEYSRWHRSGQQRSSVEPRTFTQERTYVMASYRATSLFQAAASTRFFPDVSRRGDTPARQDDVR